MEEKTLTVVIPAYNMEKYLRRCLDSLMVGEERMSALEVLVINDGSRDATSAIAHGYEARYPGTFRVIDKPNGHYGSCVNRGVAEARGKYIKILDADDWYDTRNFAAYIDALKGTDADLVLNDYVLIREDGSIARAAMIKAAGYTPLDFFGTLFKRQRSIGMHAMAYKTSNVRALRYRQAEGITHTDRQWNFVPLFNVTTAYYVPLVVYMYFIGREGQSMKMTDNAKVIHDNLVIAGCLLDALAHTPHDKDKHALLKDECLRKVNAIYKEVIFQYGDETNEQLRRFDEQFKRDYPALYDEAPAIMTLVHGMPYKYLPYWRAHGRVNSLDPAVALYKAVYTYRHRRYMKKFES